MNVPRTSPTPSQSRDVWERISKRLEDLAQREGVYANSKQIALMRHDYFADVDALEKSGRVKVPKQ